jgi:hypothetical protein
MGLCASSNDSVIENQMNGPTSNSNQELKKGGSQLKISNIYQTSNDNNTNDSRSKMKLGFAVPQSLLQRQQNQGESKMNSATRNNIMDAFKNNDSGISQFSLNQLQGTLASEG